MTPFEVVALVLIGALFCAVIFLLYENNSQTNRMTVIEQAIWQMHTDNQIKEAMRGNDKEKH